MAFIHFELSSHTSHPQIHGVQSLSPQTFSVYSVFSCRREVIKWTKLNIVMIQWRSAGIIRFSRYRISTIWSEDHIFEIFLKTSEHEKDIYMMCLQLKTQTTEKYHMILKLIKSWLNHHYKAIRLQYLIDISSAVNKENYCICASSDIFTWDWNMIILMFWMYCVCVAQLTHILINTCTYDGLKV